MKREIEIVRCANCKTVYHQILTCPNCRSDNFNEIDKEKKIIKKGRQPRRW